MDEVVKNTEVEEKEALTQEEATESLEATEVEATEEGTTEEAKQEKTFTQAQVNEIVQTRLDRERKKWERKEDNDEVAKEAEKAEEEECQAEKANANQEELDGLRIENIALKKGISEKHLGYLKSLVNAHEGEYSERIDKVLEDFPFLKEEKEAPKVVRASVGKSQNAPKALTKAEIMEIKDPKVRRQAIKDNQILFQK